MVLIAPPLGVAGAAVALVATFVGYAALTSQRFDDLPRDALQRSLEVGLAGLAISVAFTALPVSWPVRSGLAAIAATLVAAGLLFGTDERAGIGVLTLWKRA